MNSKRAYFIFYYSKLFTKLTSVSELLRGLEAAIGIEPMNKGFAEINPYSSWRNKEGQVGTRTILWNFSCSSLFFSECRCLLQFLLQ